MKKLQKLLPIFILLTLATNVSAFQYWPSDTFTTPPNKISRFFSRIWECKWHISCYRQNKLGAFTEITSTNNINAFPTTYNANLAKTIEVGTTSVASITTLNNLTNVPALISVGTTSINSITTLSNLSTVGTIISGTWTGSVIDVARQG